MKIVPSVINSKLLYFAKEIEKMVSDAGLACFVNPNPVKHILECDIFGNPQQKRFFVELSYEIIYDDSYHANLISYFEKRISEIKEQL